MLKHSDKNIKRKLQKRIGLLLAGLIVCGYGCAKEILIGKFPFPDNPSPFADLLTAPEVRLENKTEIDLGEEIERQFWLQYWLWLAAISPGFYPETNPFDVSPLFLENLP